MEQMTLHLPQARRSDPSTSKAAARRAERFQSTHAARILEAIRHGCIGGLNAEEIANATDLTVVQVDRRTVELERKGLIRVRKSNGKDLVRKGMRVWVAI